MRLSPTCGIYQIRCTANGRVYVGSSLNIEARLQSHFKALVVGKHMNDRLLADYVKHGEKSFKASILEVCPAHVRLNREQYWIDLTKPYYNLSPVARQKHVSRDQPIKADSVVVSATKKKPPIKPAKPAARAAVKKRVPKSG